METVLILGFVSLLAFWVWYQDRMYRKDLERKDGMLKDLELKLLSRNAEEYQRVAGPPPEDTESEGDEYIDADEVDPEVALRARDNL